MFPLILFQVLRGHQLRPRQDRKWLISADCLPVSPSCRLLCLSYFKPPFESFLVTDSFRLIYFLISFRRALGSVRIRDGLRYRKGSRNAATEWGGETLRVSFSLIASILPPPLAQGLSLEWIHRFQYVPS